MVRQTFALLVFLLSLTAYANQPYQQVFVGYNGPSTPSASYFQDERSLRDSWVAAALPPRELDKILSNIRFGPQILLVSAVGERKAVTEVRLGHINSKGNAMTVFVLIGVANTDCLASRPNSTPFVISVVDKPEAFDGQLNFFHQNLPDQCKTD